MESMRKEIRNRRILFFISVFVLILAFCTLGQNIREIKYKIVSDTILSLDLKNIRVDDVSRVYASNIDPEGNEVSFELPILNIDKANNLVNVSFVTLAFFPSNASGKNPDYISFVHNDSNTDVFFTDGQKLVDIWYKRSEK